MGGWTAPPPLLSCSIKAEKAESPVTLRRSSQEEPMRYQGGKSRIAGEIAQNIRKVGGGHSFLSSAAGARLKNG